MIYSTVKWALFAVENTKRQSNYLRSHAVKRGEKETKMKN